MSEPFLAEITIVAFNFAPRGWAQCDGQILPIAQNQSLFSIMGTTYGGDGRSNFGLPDLRGRVPIHEGTSGTPGSGSYALGLKGGEETHALTVAEMPGHRHAIRGKAAAEAAEAEGEVPGQGEVNLYRDPGTQVAMSAQSVAPTGSGSGHENMQPFLALNYVIALQGTFPSRN